MIGPSRNSFLQRPGQPAGSQEPADCQLHGIVIQQPLEPCDRVPTVHAIYRRRPRAVRRFTGYGRPRQSAGRVSPRCITRLKAQTERNTQRQHQDFLATNKKVMTMLKLTRDLWTDEGGFLISMELVLIATIGVLGLIVGLSCLSNAVVGELQDLGWSVRSLNQSYYFGGFRGCKSWVPGSSYVSRGTTPNNNLFNDTSWDIGIGTNVQTYTPGSVITPTLQPSTTVVCPPLTNGPSIVDPNTVIVPGTTTVPCPTVDCTTVPATPTGPLTPTPDNNIPGPAPLPSIR